MIQILQRIERNPRSLPPWHPRAGEMAPGDGISHQPRWGCDDNGMWLGDFLHAELQRTVACALNGDTGSAALITACGNSLTVNLNVAGFGGRPRWGGYHKGYVCGGALFIDEGARQRIIGMPGFETVNGQVVRGNHFDPAKVIIDHGQVVHHHHAGIEHIHHNYRSTW